MQLLKCKREETTKDRNKEAFCCALEGVSFLQLRSKFAFFAFFLDWCALEGVSFIQLRSKFASLLSCSIDVLLFGSFFFEGLVFWELLLLWWCSSSSSSSSACVCSEINLSCFCFLGGVFWFGTFVFFWWVGFPCLFVAGFVCVCVCVRIFFAVCNSCWNLSSWVWKFLFVVVVVVVCLSSLERMGFLRWESSDCLRSVVAMPNSCLCSCWCFQLFSLWMWLLELLFSCVQPAKQEQ